MKSIKNGYGNRLRKERLRLDLSQEQIANECDISRVQWGKYEREIVPPSKKVLKKLQALEVDVDFVVLGNTKTQNFLGNCGIDSRQDVDIQSLDELQLIRLYRTLSMAQKETLIQMLLNLYTV